MKKADGQFGFEATDDERLIVARVAGAGFKQEAICRLVVRDGKAISLATLKRHFREELTDGRELADAALANKAYELAIAGNPQVLIHMTKVRLGWKEPATEINMRQTYEELVKKSYDAPKVPGPALQVVSGGKT